MLRLMETHPAAAVERAVRAALERHSPRLETVRLILRQQQAARRRCARRSRACVWSWRGSRCRSRRCRRMTRCWRALPGGRRDCRASAPGRRPEGAGSVDGCRAVAPPAEQAVRQRQTPADYLAQLVHLEVTGRREPRIQRRIQGARFPMLKTLDAFSFEAQPDLDRDAVLQLFDCRFVAEGTNVVFVGGVGTGRRICRSPWGSPAASTTWSTPASWATSRSTRPAPTCCSGSSANATNAAAWW